MNPIPPQNCKQESATWNRIRINEVSESTYLFPQKSSITCHLDASCRNLSQKSATFELAHACQHSCIPESWKITANQPQVFDQLENDDLLHIVSDQSQFLSEMAKYLLSCHMVVCCSVQPRSDICQVLTWKFRFFRLYTLASPLLWAVLQGGSGCTGCPRGGLQMPFAPWSIILWDVGHCQTVEIQM